MTPKVMPPGHIKWPDLKLCFSKFDIVPKAHQWFQLFETRSVQKDIGFYNLHSSDFFYIGDLRLCQFHDLPIRSQWWKN